MDKVTITLFLLLTTTYVLAQADWSGFDFEEETSQTTDTTTSSTSQEEMTTGANAQQPITEETTAEETITSTEQEPTIEEQETQTREVVDKSTPQTKTVYNENFTYALGMAAGGILLLLIFVYFFFKKPKDHWKQTPNPSRLMPPNTFINRRPLPQI